MATRASKKSTDEVASAPLPTVGAIIDHMWAAREEKRRLEAEVKQVESRIKDIEAKLADRMRAEGLKKATGTKATASFGEPTVSANVTDWDLLWPYIAKNKYFHMVQRRINDTAYRELLDLGKKVPGVEAFTKQRLNLSSL